MTCPPQAEAAAVVDRLGTLTYRELRADYLGLRTRVPHGSRAVVETRMARNTAAAFVSLQGWAAQVDLRETGGSSTDAGAAVILTDVDPLAPVLQGEHQIGDEVATTWRLFTSGTTGEPKPVSHTLPSLTRSVRPTAGDRRRWGLLYGPTRMAGVQVLLQSLGTGDTLIDASGHGRLGERVDFMVDNAVDSLSATPTLWRQILQSPNARDLPLRQITLGGEIADQRILDALRHAYPAAHITHVFASTESGVAFAVGDGREGFPLAYLTRAPRGVRLEVRDGVLFVHAPGSSLSGTDDFVDTGDLVDIHDDRVTFRGRASGIVNVGGVKVAPEQVESALRSHPEVLDAVVRSRSNSFSGNILVAEVVATQDASTPDLSRRLRADIAVRLSTAHAPASIKIVDVLETSAAGKAGR